MQRLNYIGSKYKLLDWILATMQEKTGFEDFAGKRVADLFAGTGVVSHKFRQLGSVVIGNDAELYSYIITNAFTTATYSQKLADIIQMLNSLNADTPGYITKHYSPYADNERKFFTVENAMKIDCIRDELESIRNDLTDKEYIFLLASLIVSADAVSNVPAVYGCYLKKFKDKAKKTLELKPIHQYETHPLDGSKVYNHNVLSFPFDDNEILDIVYLDPPYNERQYSKNYFPLNMIAKHPAELLQEPDLKGKTGIPTDCYVSPFCKCREVERAFKELFAKLSKISKWIFLSYNSESLVPKDKMIKMMEEYGNVSCVEQDYKRFKSFEYNKDVSIKEYLFCLEVTQAIYQ